MATVINNNPLPQRARSNINRILRANNTSTNNNQPIKSKRKNKRVTKRLARRRKIRRNLFKPKGQINKAIRSMPMNSMEKAYAMCRLNPFKSLGKSLGIPDGSDVKRILMDHRMINTFTIGDSGSVRIAITPAIPSSVWWQGDSTTKLNGATFSFNTTPLFRCIVQPEWRDLPCNLEDLAGHYNPAMAIFNSTKARIVTVGWNLTYTGTSLDNSGGMIINAQQLTMGNTIPNTTSFTIVNSQSGSNKGFNPSQILLRILNDKPSFGYSNNNETNTIALQRGAHGILRHSANEYEWCDVSNNMVIPAWASDETISALTSQEYGTESTIGHWPHVASFDPSWVSTLINIQGAKPGATFMLDTIYCVEYCPSPSSTVFAIAKGGPTQNNTVMQHVDNAAKNLPIAQNGTAQNDNSVSNVVSTISNAVKVGATIASFIP